MFILSFLGMTFCMLNAQNPNNSTKLFNSDWRFHRGGASTAGHINFDDSQWRLVDLPHDWSIEDLPGTNSPFNPDAISQVRGGYTTGGTGWYRKTFMVPADQKGKNFTILFEGVYMNAEVFINGQLLGVHHNGYTSFGFDITDKIQFGQDNVLAVKVRNWGENSRWYSGSGIYRHVWLSVSSPVHISTWGTSVTTPDVTPENAKTMIKTTIENKSGENAEIRLVARVISPAGKESVMIETKATIAPGVPQIVQQLVDIKDPELWSVESPNLYKVVSEVFVGSDMVDQKETTFGIRTISFDAINGFQLNGKTLKLKGGNVHHDNGPLGSRAYDRAEERRVEILKASGYNAIRCAHNPPSPAFLDACDRLGMLVMNEAFDMWEDAKYNAYDYSLYFDKSWKKDIESMVYRDRNHPSVILWSIGNEIPNSKTLEVTLTSKMLADYVREIDPTRPVTAAVVGIAKDKDAKLDANFSTLDVAGYNYAFKKYEFDHARVPKRVIVCTESSPLEAFDYWMGVLDNPYVIGDFVWTSFDYMGEASIGWRGKEREQSFYPWNLAFCGDIDICGWKRPQSFYRDALWKENQLSIFVKPLKPTFEEAQDRKWHWFDAVADWNWKGHENQPVEVNIYSSCERVELFLNGKSLGKKPTNRTTKFIASWQVPYQAGSLKAIGYQGKKQVNVSELTSSGDVAQLKLTADRVQLKADGQDLAYVTVELVDASGVLNPKADNLVKFEIEGPGTIVGVGNANPVSLESNQQPQRKAWRGRCLVIIKTALKPGKILLKATSDAAPSASLELLSGN
jgi:beta-galactosidase